MENPVYSFLFTPQGHKSWCLSNSLIGLSRQAAHLSFTVGETRPQKLLAKHVERFLSYLTMKGKVSASTQRQALNQMLIVLGQYREREKANAAMKLVDICTIQMFWGIRDILTFMIYTHVASKNKLGVKSPLDM